MAISWIAIQVVKLNARPPKRKPPNTEGRSLLGGRKEHSFLQLHGLPGQVAEINVRKPKDRNPFFLVMRNESNYEKIIHPKYSVFTSKNHLYTVYIYMYKYILYILYIYYISIPKFSSVFFHTSTSYLLLPCLPTTTHLSVVNIPRHCHHHGHCRLGIFGQDLAAPKKPGNGFNGVK